MATAQNQGIYDADPGTSRPTPTSFRQWCENVLQPAVLNRKAWLHPLQLLKSVEV